MERGHMGRTKLSFGKLDWTNLLEMAAVGICWRGAFQCVFRGAAKNKAEDVFIAGRSEQRTRHGSAE